LWLGIAVEENAEGQQEVGFASHDGTYSVDFAVTTLAKNQAEGSDHATQLADYLIQRIGAYREEHLYKFLGAGLSEKLVRMSPQLPARLWLELDIIPFVLKHDEDESEESGTLPNAHTSLQVDEEADSMARKCLG
jgi:alpha,alpha-trehalose phosphorylase (configuration-retaining)